MKLNLNDLNIHQKGKSRKKYFNNSLIHSFFLFGLVFLFNQSWAQTVITTYAGNGTAGFSGDGGQATAAELNYPFGVASDNSGNIFITDRNNQRIRKVTSAGIISTICGNGEGAFTGDGGSAAAAQIQNPFGLATDNSGNIYIADYGNNVLRKINATTGIITTVAGTGSAGYSGDGGPATAAQLSGPAYAFIDNSGNIFIADYGNNVVRKVNTSGIISTVAGNTSYSSTGDGGPATDASMRYAATVVVDGSGNIYISDQQSYKIRKVNTSGIISTVVGTGTPGFSGDGGPATAAELDVVTDLKFDANYNLFISDQGNSRIRKVDAATGIITTVAGNGTPGFSGDGGPATAAAIAAVGIAFDPNGYMYIVDFNGNRIRKIVGLASPSSTITGNASICLGDTTTLSCSPSGGKWSCSATTVANIDSTTGLATGLTAGTAVISYVQGGSTTTKTITVNVASVNIPSIIHCGSTAFCPGGSTTLSTSGYAFTDFGSSSYITVPDQTYLRFTNSQSYTLTAWVYSNGSTGSWQGVIDKSRLEGSWYGLWIDNTGHWVYGTENAGMTNNITGTLATVGWHHIALVQTGGVGRVLYVDGVSVATGAAETTDGTGPLNIGSSYTGFEPTNSGGAIDEVAIFNTNLSPSTIMTYMYSVITPSHPNFSNLVGYWKLDECSGGVVYDSSGNGNNGVALGGSNRIISTAPFTTHNISSYLWSPGGATTSTISASVSGNYSVTVRDANNCALSSAPVAITVYSSPTITLGPNPMVCTGSTSASLPYSAATNSPTNYSITWNSTAITNGFTNATGATLPTSPITVSVPLGASVGTYTATLNVTNANGCTSSDTTITIVVSPTPTVSTISNQSVCSGENTSTVNFSGSATNYSWTNSNSSIGLATTGSGNIGSFTATNTGSSPLIDTITVTPSTALCSGTSQFFTITVNPTPAVSTPTNQTVCNNLITTAVNFTGSLGGTTYSWTNSNSTIGLTTTGTGNISAFVAINTGTTSVIDTITVTPNANGCNGNSQYFTVTVFPTPTVNIVTNQTVCNDTNTAPVSFTGTISSATYSWASSNATIGLSTTGTGNISAFPGTNTTGNPVIDTIIVTPSFNGCIGLPDSFMITVNPTPSVIVPLNQTVCNSLNTTGVIFTGAVSGTTYAWVNSNSTIGLTTTGTGNISSFTATNLGTNEVIDTITVTPLANGCTGNTQYFTVTVFPTPTVNIISNQTVCNGTNTAPISFTGTISGTTYSWASSSSTIGVATTGTGNISAFSATNTTTNPVIDTIIVTPSANSCLGLSDTFTIRVNPTPVLSGTLFPPAFCNNTTFNYIQSSATAGTTFAWSRALLTGISNVASSGSGNISETIHDTTPNPVTVIYIDTLKANTCVNVQTITVTVNPTPQLNSVLTPPAICNNTVFNYNPTSATAGTTFSWRRATMIGLLNNSASGLNNPIETLTDTLANPILVTYEYDLSAHGCTDTQFVKVAVNPTPNLNSPLRETTCSGSLFNYNPSSLTYGASFNWYRAAITGISNPAKSDTATVNEILVNTTSSAINVAYTYTLGVNGCTNTQNVIVTVNPTPAIPTIDTKTPSTLCANTQFQNFGTANPAASGEYYTWSSTNSNIWNVGSGNQYCLISFPQSGTSVVTLTTTNAATNCKSETNYAVSVNSSESLTPQMIYYNHHFVCLEYDADSYVWGYDDVVTLDSTLIPNESNENLFDPNPDFANRYYWVISNKNGCWQKSYYTVPPANVTSVNTDEFVLNIYPNPVDNIVNIELSGIIPQNVEVKIYDLLGNEVMAFPLVNDKTQMNLEKLNPGLYMVSCYKDSYKVSTSKIIKR